MSKKGPLYVAMFKPIGIIFAVIMGIGFLGGSIYLGRYTFLSCLNHKKNWRCVHLWTYDFINESILFSCEWMQFKKYFSLRTTIMKGGPFVCVCVWMQLKNTLILEGIQLCKYGFVYVQCAWSSHSGYWFLCCYLGEKPRASKGRVWSLWWLGIILAVVPLLENKRMEE